jgi:Ser/Thr protein kinase RdoA (MazF antagonist)
MATATSTPEATDLFLSLTPDRVLAAVDASGLRSRPVCYPLNSFENRVYEVELEDCSRIVAKFYRPGRWSAAQILEEHAFLAALDAEEIPVCPPRPFPDGATLKQIDHIWYTIFERRGGRAPDELDDAAARRLGTYAARLHNVGARQPAGHRPALDAESYVRDAVAWLADHGAVPGPLERRYEGAALALAEIAESLMDGVAVHLVHADLHLGNVLLRDCELRVLDFDDMRVGPAVQDVWLALPGRDRESLRQREVFLDGYEQFRAFDRSTLRFVEPLRGLRMVHYAAWLAQRWHDPAFQAGWPHFGTPDYWRQETEDLEELLAVVERAVVRDEQASRYAGTARVMTGPVEEALTNRDYFWDWEGD